MKVFFVFYLKVLALGLCGFPAVLLASPSPDILPLSELIKALQSGGHIIYMRHAKTNHSQKDENRRDLTDCSTQRNLSEDGIAQAKRIGQVLRSYKIPVGDVLSSPYCRCKDTARLVFGNYKINSELGFSISKDAQESKQLGRLLYDMMLNAKTLEGNAVFVGHTSNLRDGLGVWPKPEGVIAVFTLKNAAPVFRGMIRPEDWDQSLDSKAEASDY